MRQKFAVEMVDGSEWEVVADGRDIRAYETHSGQSFLTTKFTYNQVTDLAAHASIRLGLWAGTPEEFVEQNVGIEILGEVERLDPTPRGVTEPSSSPSPSAPASPPKPGTKRDRQR
jgi:hypothetical protein